MTSAPVAGVMERVTLDAGDRVVAGETVLTRIEAPRAGFYDLREAAEAKARVTSTEAQRDLAAADVERAEAELKRDKELAPRGAVTDRDLESAELDVPVKQAAVEVAKHTLAAKTAEVAVAKAALIAPEGDEPPSGLASQGTADAQPRALEPGIKAPPAMRVLALVTGFLLRKIKESETMVAAGDPLFELGTIAQLEVLVEMLSEDAVKVRAGAPAVMEGWGCAHALKGVVRRVEPFGFTKISALGIEEQRVNVIVDFTDARTAWEPLGHGYRVDVAIETWKGKDVLQVPIGALFRERDRWTVYTVDATGIVDRRSIRVAHKNNRNAEVLSGLSAGDVVTLHPSDRIEEGMLVAPREADGP